MNTVLWALQVILSIKLMSAAFTHGIRHDQPQMQQGIQRMGRVAQPLLVAIAILTLLGAAGLVLPAALGVLTWLTPLSAAIVAGWMLCAIAFHLHCREKPNVIVSLALFAIAALVAYGRWAISPL